MLLPPRCLSCGDTVDQHGAVCPVCWSELRFITAPICRCCGVPLGSAAAGEPICEECVDQDRKFDRARAALRYEGIGRRLVLRFKHNDRIEVSATMARWMEQAGGAMLEGTELLVPVPMHRWRLVHRGYNQAAILARRIGQTNSIPCFPDLLRKRHATVSQQGLNAAQRKINITSDVFEVSKRHREAVEGRRIILIDDVLTTSATVSACAGVLIEAGAAAVDVLTLARVVREFEF